jgi:hypothetical protein
LSLLVLLLLLVLRSRLLLAQVLLTHHRSFLHLRLRMHRRAELQLELQREPLEILGSLKRLMKLPLGQLLLHVVQLEQELLKH